MRCIVLVLSLLGGICDDPAPARRETDLATLLVMAQYDVTRTEAEVIRWADPHRYRHRNPDVDRWHWWVVLAGFPLDDWRRWSCIINGESRGQWDILADDSDDYSVGPMQLNLIGGLWSRFNPLLAEFGLPHGDRQQVAESLLSSPRVYFAAAHQLYAAAGTSPWRATRGPCG
jgi:hypothetical protein